VRIIRYVSEGTFDVFSWQTVERKACFINQIMRGDITERSFDDVSDQALSYAEVQTVSASTPRAPHGTRTCLFSAVPVSPKAAKS
jgi:hypothetical protein